METWLSISVTGQKSQTRPFYSSGKPKARPVMPAKKSDNVKVCYRFSCMQPHALDRHPAPFTKKAARCCGAHGTITIDEFINPCPDLAPANPTHWPPPILRLPSAHAAGRGAVPAVELEREDAEMCDDGQDRHTVRVPLPRPPYDRLPCTYALPLCDRSVHAILHSCKANARARAGGRCVGAGTW